MLRVSKFGGSSVGSSSAIRTVCERIVAQQEASVVTVPVVSAMYGVTNILVSETLSTSEKKERIADLHLRAARDLTAGVAREQFGLFMYAEIDEAFSKDATLEVRASLGERLSSRLVSAHIEAIGSPSSPVDDVIVTDDNGTPNMKQSKDACVDGILRLSRTGVIPVVAGFYGRSMGGRRTLLGRGGTDLSAAIVARSVNADELTLWKVECHEDEEGRMESWAPGYVGLVHEADPCSTIPHVHYSHASELAAIGKKVLHPDTVFPAVMGSIPIAIRNTLDPETDGTLIDADAEGFVTVASSGSRIVLVGEKNLLQAKHLLNRLQELSLIHI